MGNALTAVFVVDPRSREILRTGLLNLSNHGLGAEHVVIAHSVDGHIHDVNVYGIGSHSSVSPA